MINKLDHLIVAVKNIEEAELNYSKLFGTSPVWRGEHKALGTTNSIFNFSNTYFELLAAKGDGLGANLVEHTLKEKGEGLAGLVLGTNDINQAKKNISSSGRNVSTMAIYRDFNLMKIAHSIIKKVNEKKFFNNNHSFF